MSNIHNLSTPEKIVLVFLENSEKDFTIRELSKLVGIDYKSVYFAVDSLHKIGILEKRKAGNSILCKLGKVFDHIIYKVEEYRKNELLKNNTIRVIYNEMKKVKSSFYVCLLFGSYAKGKVTKSSDIDMIIVAENKESLEKELDNIIESIPIKIHLLTFTPKEFLSNLLAGNTVVNEAVEKNIILYGIESYYRLLKYD